MDLLNPILWVSVLFLGAQCQYPGAPPAEPVNYPMIPTDSDFANFQCFSEEEIVSIREEFETITPEFLHVTAFLPFKADDWSLPSLLTSILNREIAGGHVELYEFYDGASSIVGKDQEAMVIHHEILEKDNGFGGPHVDVHTTEIPLRTRWYIRSDIAAEIENGLGSDSNLHLDLWRSFAHSTVLEAMNSSQEIIMDPDDDGQFACSFQHGCMLRDSTWYPPQCNATSNARCMVLLQFLPEHDMELNRAHIVDHNLPVVIKYMGSERSIIGQRNFRRFYEDRSRVIFQLRSTETQSIDAYGWTAISLPPGGIMKDQPMLYVSTSLFKVSQAHFLFYYFTNAMLQQSQVDRIKHAISMENEQETKDLRLEKACDWLKNPMNKNSGWGIWFKRAFITVHTTVDCPNVPDETLTWLDKRSEAELVAGVLSNNEYFSKVVGISEAYQAVFAKNNCISWDQEDGKEALLIIGYVLVGLALMLSVAVLIATIKWSQQLIISTACLPVLLMVHLGAVVTLCYSLFLKHDNSAHCVIRKYILQIGIGLMFGGLWAKTWKLHKMIENQKMLKNVEISDLRLVLNTIGTVAFVAAYITVLLLMFPVEIREKIESGKISSVCEWNDSAATAYRALLIFEIVVLFVAGKSAWSSRVLNPVHNEHKFIGVINLGAVLIVSGHLVAGLVKQTASMIAIQSYLVTLLVVLVISLLMVPKFMSILSDKEYEPDHFESSSITFSSSVLTKEDVRRMRRLCRKHGYRVSTADRRKLTEANLSITGTSKRKFGSLSSGSGKLSSPLVK